MVASARTSAGDNSTSVSTTRRCRCTSAPFAALLLLLYGNPVTRTVALTAADIQHRDDQYYLRLDEHPVLIPPPLAHLILQLRDVDSPGSSLGRAVADQRWLFPGRHPGTHRGGKQLTRVLTHTYGIDVRCSRNTALLALAERLPAAVLADLLGLHRHTAAGWVKLVQRDWTDYITERS